MDACCDKPVLQYHVGQKQFHVIGQTDAIVVNSFVLRTIAGAWNAWDPAGALGPLFQALHALLRDDHRFREFNAAQMNRVGMVDALLIFCKVLFFIIIYCTYIKSRLLNMPMTLIDLYLKIIVLI